VISEEARRAMSVITGIDACKSVEPDFWLNCVNRIVWDLDEAGHQDRVREIRAMLYQIWKVLPDKPRVDRCNRCELLPGRFPARSICGDCDDVLLCQACFERHAREAYDEGRESDAALTGGSLARFEAATEVVVRVAERGMALKTAPGLADFPHGVDLARPADRGPVGAGGRGAPVGHARDEPRPGVARPGGGDPPPETGEGAERA
jgi:hypothetical protein